MSVQILLKMIIITAILSIMTGCFAGPDSQWRREPPKNPEPPQAGFLAGLWHGFISVVALVFGIISDIQIYETNNTGWWYDFGFLIGAGAFSGGGIKITQHRKK